MKGIVTTFTLQTYPQGQVWVYFQAAILNDILLTHVQGGQLTFLSSELAAVTAATANFSANVTDPKAALITTYDYTGGLVSIYYPMKSH